MRARGRWNRQTYGCLYTALTAEGALAEYRKRLALLGDVDGDWQRRDLVSLEVTVEQVLDLTNAAIRRQFGIDIRTMTSDDEAALEHCRIIADVAREREYTSILAPSAAAREERNLMIYVDGPADLIELDVGGDRIPILR